MLLLVLALAVSAAPPNETPDDVLVNRFAIVQSDDGYLNLRASPSSAHEVLGEIPNGMSVQIHGCGRGAQGTRWCFVDVVEWRVFGYVYDRELVYEPEE